MSIRRCYASYFTAIGEAAIMICCTTLIADCWSGPRRSRYLGAGTGGLRPAVALLGAFAAVLAVVALLVVPRDAEALDVTS